jgi:hypothetical protein
LVDQRAGRGTGSDTSHLIDFRQRFPRAGSLGAKTQAFFHDGAPVPTHSTSDESNHAGDAVETALSNLEVISHDPGSRAPSRSVKLETAFDMTSRPES